MLEQRITRDYTGQVELRDGEGELPDIVGLAAPFYDAGNRGTEFALWGGAVERIMPTAFDLSLSDADDIYASFNHNSDNVMGRVGANTLDLRKTDAGLEYRIKANDDSQFYREMVSRIRRQDVPGSSITFSVRENGVEWIAPEDDGPEIRELHSVVLYELGPVVNPAYKATSTGIRDEQQLAEARDSHRVWKAGQKPFRRERARFWVDTVSRAWL